MSTMQGTTVCSGTIFKDYWPDLFGQPGGSNLEQLKFSLSNDDYQRIHGMSSKLAEGTFQRSKERHLNKIELLRK